MLFFLLLINFMFIDLNCFSQVSHVAHGPLVSIATRLTSVLIWIKGIQLIYGVLSFSNLEKEMQL